MPECMEILSAVSGAGVRVRAINGSRRLDEAIQSRIIATALSVAAAIERDLLSVGTREALRGEESFRKAAWATEGAGQEQA